MRLVAIVLALLMATMAALPVGAAQGSTVSECDPASCDPVVANGGQVKTGDDPVRVILFAHIRDLLQRSPLNTQPPGPQEASVTGGFLVPTASVGAPVARGFENNRFTWYFSPGPVEYQADGAWRVYQQPGFGTPFQVASDDAALYFYASPGRSATDGQEPYVVPAVGVFARVQHGYGPFGGTHRDVAAGDTGTGYGGPGASQAASTTTMVNVPGEDTVYEFRVPLDFWEMSLPSLAQAPDGPRGLLVEIVLYQLQTETLGVTDSAWQLRGGAALAPRLVIDLHEPVRTNVSRIVTVHAEATHLRFDWWVSATLGAYDVDLASARIQVEGPTPFTPELVLVDRSMDHDGLFKPVEFEWRHNLTQDPLADGVYHFNASVLNRQGTYMAQWDGSFEVKDGKPAVEAAGPTSWEGSASGIPGLVAAGVLAAAAAGLGWARSRRR